MKLTATRSAVAFHPAFAGAVMVQRKARSRWMSDDALTTDTVQHMRAYIAADASSAPVQRAAREVAALDQGGSHATLASATHQWMRAHVRFVEDADLAAGLSDQPADAEVLIRPADLFSMSDPQGDCDDFSMGTAALLVALGIPCAIKTVKCDPRDRSLWSHVYVVAQLAGGPLVLDASHGPYPGWEVSPIYKSKLWPVKPMKHTPKLRGLGEDFIDYTEGGTVSFPGQEVAGPGWDGTFPTSPTSNSNPFDWNSFIGTTENAAIKILGARYGVAQLNPGQYMRNADGSVYYQGTPGQAGGMPGLGGSGMSSGVLLLLAVGAVVLVVAMSSRNKTN